MYCGLVYHLIYIMNSKPCSYSLLGFFFLQRWYRFNVGAQNIDIISYNVILFQGITLLCPTVFFSSLKVQLFTRNLRSDLSCSALPLLVLTQTSGGHMAQVQCQPYCAGLQRCTSLGVQEIQDLQKHTLECRCSVGQTCNDLALYIHADAAIDSSQPVEVCHVDLD